MLAIPATATATTMGDEWVTISPDRKSTCSKLYHTISEFRCTRIRISTTSNALSLINKSHFCQKMESFAHLRGQSFVQIRQNNHVRSSAIIQLRVAVGEDLAFQRVAITLPGMPLSILLPHDSTAVRRRYREASGEIPCLSAAASHHALNVDMLSFSDSAARAGYVSFCAERC